MKNPILSLPKQLCTVIALTAAFAGAVIAAPEWTFDAAGDLQGWLPIQQLTGGAVKDGALTALTTDGDPAFIGPVISAAAKEVSSVVVRMKLEGKTGGAASDPGAVQLFWASSAKPDFNEEASRRVDGIGDGQWHDYTFAVGESEDWKETIIRIRIDPCNTADTKVSIDSIRFLGGAAAAAAKPAPEWTFDTAGNLQGWNPAQHLTAAVVKDGALTALTEGEDPILMSPPFKATAKEFSSVVVRMKLQNSDGAAFTDSNELQLFWRTSAAPAESEEASIRIETAADGQFHDYKFAVSENSEWKDTITGLRVDPCGVSGVKVSIDSVKLQK
ncbi:MAG: hypothetical protein NTZ16_07370 [Verrucomicrobia bacterium]|nr:hypothetical protein [Verrucomicrobiota bacterium]